MKWIYFLISLTSLVLALGTAVWAFDSKSAKQAEQKSGFKLGDRLPAAKAKPPAAPATSAPAASYKEIKWEELVPKDWDPAKEFKDLNLAGLSDSDPRAAKALEKLKEAWDNAPANPAFNGQRVRIPGFLVPVERTRDVISEFLLVPYFGACIHTPPPPSNQVIHVFPAKMVKGMNSMDPVWVNGVIEVSRSGTTMGTASYRLNADLVEAYKEPKR